MHPPAPPPIDPSELRPRRRWYVWAGVIGGVLALAGIGGFAYGVVTAATAGGLGKKFDVGETVTVRLKPEPQSAIYVARLPGGGAPAPECTVASPTGNDVRLSSPSYSFTYTRGGVTWQLRYLVHVDAAGDYRVSCRPTSGDVATEHAIGEAPRMGRFFGGIFGGLASLFVLPTMGVVIGATMAVVVAVRRGDHRRRLQAERAGFPPHQPPHPPPGPAHPPPGPAHPPPPR